MRSESPRGWYMYILLYKNDKRNCYYYAMKNVHGNSDDDLFVIRVVFITLENYGDRLFGI